MKAFRVAPDNNEMWDVGMHLPRVIFPSLHTHVVTFSQGEIPFLRGGEGGVMLSETLKEILCIGFLSQGECCD